MDTTIREWCPTGRVELHLYERRSGMVGADRWINNVAIAFGITVRYRINVTWNTPHPKYNSDRKSGRHRLEGD
jgi:hypothetical protein